MSYKAFKYLVLGGGPSGIITVGKLLDKGVKNIAWVDPQFRVGRMGQYYQNVPSNTKVKSFLSVLTGCESFNFKASDRSHRINGMDPAKTCQLSDIVQPLQLITDHLRKHPQITSFQSQVTKIDLLKAPDQTHCYLDPKMEIVANSVILASGSAPRVGQLLPYQKLIPLDDAVDSERLAKFVTGKDIIGVYGVSHSGMLALRNLMNLSPTVFPQKIVSFSNREVRYAVDKGTHYIYDNTGLKGEIADWARQHYDILDVNSQLVKTDAKNGALMAECTKIIYATGFERSPIAGLHPILLDKYNNQTGQIMKNLYGVGIAFPNQVVDASCGLESNVGLLKFMRHLDTNLSSWISES